MQRSASSYPPLSLPEADRVRFNVLIAYEDFESGKHARKTVEYLTEHLGGDCQFIEQMWKFDVLGLPKLREMAARDATSADILILSCQGTNPLPESLKGWVETWLMEDVGPACLVLLSASSVETDQLTEIRKYASEIAERGNMEFFIQPANAAELSAPDVLQARPRMGLRFAEEPLAAMAPIAPPHAPLPRWGINE